jgi:hypothetical protein
MKDQRAGDSDNPKDMLFTYKQIQLYLWISSVVHGFRLLFDIMYKILIDPVVPYLYKVLSAMLTDHKRTKIDT